MEIGQVMEGVTLGRCLPSLVGCSLWLVVPEGHQGPGRICADPLGVALGQRVLVVEGSSARLASGDAPVDATIVGILAT